MNLWVYSAFLCVVSLNCIWGSHEVQYGCPKPTPKCCLEGDACRTYCPKTLPTTDVTFQLVDGASPEYIFIYFTGQIYFLCRGAYDDSTPGVPGSANLYFYDVVAVFFKLRGAIYYFSTLGTGNPYGGCARVTELKNTTRSEVSSVPVPNDLLLKAIRLFNLPFERQCTVLVRRDIPAGNPSFYILSADLLYSVYVCQPAGMNNASFSAFKDYTNRNGENDHIRIDPGSVQGRYYCEYGSYIDGECGTTSTCPVLHPLDDFETVIRNGGCDPNCINTVNKNAVSLAARCYAAGSTVSTQPPVLVSSFRAAVFGPPTSSKISFFEIAGFCYAAAINDFFIKFFSAS